MKTKKTQKIGLKVRMLRISPVLLALSWLILPGQVLAAAGDVCVDDGTGNPACAAGSNASVGGTLAVTGTSTLSGATTINNTLGVTGASTLGGATTINNTLGVTGTTNINTTGTAATTIGNNGTGTAVSVNGGNSTASLANNSASLAITNGGSVSTNDSSATLGAGGNGVTTYENSQTLSNTPATLATELNNVGDAASRQNIAGADFVNRVEGNTLVNGDMYINGSLAYTSNSSATTTVTSGSSVIAGATQNTQGQMSIANAGGTGAIIDGNGKITNGAVNQSTASLTLTNGQGNTHGLVVNEQNAVISGGVNSSSMTLNDNGATFSNSASGSPIQLHGVANGTLPTDAVNYRQLKEVSTRAYSGVAQVAAMQAIPAPVAGKTYSLGMGGGFYGGQQAIAFGGKALVGEHVNVGASVSTGFGSNSEMAASVGAGFSW